MRVAPALILQQNLNLVEWKVCSVVVKDTVVLPLHISMQFLYDRKPCNTHEIAKASVRFGTHAGGGVFTNSTLSWYNKRAELGARSYLLHTWATRPTVTDVEKTD